MTLTAGTRLGPYEILAPIGAGGMGEVWKATDTRLDRVVAIKVLNGPHSDRFEQEARAIAALNHPHICTLYDVGPNYLVMEYIDGVALSGPLPVEEALRLALQMAAALEAAHAKGITHRDLKPANILVTKQGVKLLDFGLAKAVDGWGATGDATRTIEGTILGTPSYMAPEQIEGKPCDARSDVFSFGAVLYEMLAGSRAFEGMAAVLRDDPKPPPALERLVMRCLEKQAARRFQTMAELREALGKAAQVGTSVHQQPSIAVLPFANMSADKENEYFSDGLAEEIINALTQVAGLKIPARTSAFFFKGKDVKIAEIARELGVEHVLEGSVRKAGNRIRVTAQLIKAADGYHLWSQRYDREMTDVFAIQDEISAAIADQLKVHLTGRKRPTANIAAYELFLEGRHLWYRGSVERARECYDKAIALDPGYAPAYAGICECHMHSATRLADPREVIPKIEAAARRALELDPSLADAHSMLGLVSAFSYRWDEARNHFLHAMELSSSAIHNRAGYVLWYLLTQGFLEEALRVLDRAASQDPLSPLRPGLKAFVFYYSRRFDEAAEWLRRALDLNARNPTVAIYLGRACAYQNQFEQAMAVVEQAIQESGRSAWTLLGLGTVHALAGHADEAHRVLEELHQLAQSRYVPASFVVRLHALLGEKDAAFEWAGTAFDQRDPNLLRIKVDPAFDSLRSDPRYPALLEKMNLAREH
jgi:TolB-like protein/Tfp pilus assembly protein PilF